jgi:uncharacterized ubiquitin-like protein YukD
MEYEQFITTIVLDRDRNKKLVDLAIDARISKSEYIRRLIDTAWNQRQIDNAKEGEA